MAADDDTAEDSSPATTSGGAIADPHVPSVSASAVLGESESVRY